MDSENSVGSEHRDLWVLAIALGGALCFAACGDESESPQGSGGAAPAPSVGGAGTPASSGGIHSGAGGAGGGPTGSGGSATCSSTSPCGGELLGQWTVASSCLDVSGELDLTFVGTACRSTPISGSLHVTGSFSINADGTYADHTVTTGEETFDLAPSCLVISSTPVNCSGAADIIKNLGFTTLSCSTAAGGGCSCRATLNQTGGIGHVSFAPPTSGNYTLAGNSVSLTGDSGPKEYAYCSTGNVLTLTPASESPTVVGAISLQRDGAGGSGAAGGAGGLAGMAGAGGAPHQGGASNLGGSAGSPLAGAGGQAGQGGTNATGGAAGSAGATAGMGGAGGGSPGPCDIYLAAGNPCVAAHSTVRALFAAYSGKLYQVRNTAGATLDIPTLAPGGIADGAAQDAFCMGTTCVVTVVYDQSGKGNDLWYQGSTQVPGSPSSSPAKATSESLSVSGHKVYSLYINAGNSYWVDASKSGIALGAEPEGMYMVTNSKHYNGGCCFDYGNSETDRKADGSGAMDAINFSAITAWGTGAGSGPWVMADLEYGVFAQNNTNKNQNNPTQTSTYVTAVLKNDGKNEFAIRGGNAASGPLGTYYKGGLPGGWSPMKKQGAIVLGSGGDCCKPDGGANLSIGTFYEGCIVTGYPSDATEDAVQANIVAAKYGQ